MKLNIGIPAFIIFNLASVLLASGQVPSISSFTPGQGPIGTLVTIAGHNFSAIPANNIVYFGATRSTVSAATTTQLTVTTPKGATYQPITVTVNGLTAYSSASFVVTFNSNKIVDPSSFAEKIDLPIGLTPNRAIMGDLDDDGKTDLLVSNYFSANVSALKNASSPGTISSVSFNSKVDFITGYGPSGMALGDIDGDGKQDMVTIYSGTTVSVYKNISVAGAINSGSFSLGVDFLIGYGIALTEVAIGDLDGDGKPDLAVTEQMGNKVLVFKNVSTSGIIDANSFMSKVEFATSAMPMGVAIADLDGDGKPEIATANHNGNTISVFRNKSSVGTIDINSFEPKVDFTSGPNGTVDLAIGDLDGDNKPDMAVANYLSNTVSILKNTTTTGAITSSSFAAKVDFETGTGPQSIAMGDLDGDGKIDLAVANASANVTDATANKISVLKNISTIGTIGSKSFGEKVDFAAGQNPTMVVIGDLDGDGRPDLAATNYNGNTVSVLRNKDSQTITSFTAVSEKKMGDPAFALVATSSSGLTVQFTTTSEKVVVTGSQLSLIKPGSVTIAAEQAGNNTYSAAPKVLQTFCIIPTKPVITVNLTDITQPLLTSSSDIGNMWYRNENLIEGATAKTYIVKDKGIYKVKVNIEACISPLSNGESVIVTSVAQTESLTRNALYPNPVQDMLTILLDAFNENDDVSIMMVDGIGRVMTKQIGKGGQELNIDVRNYNSGPYYVLMSQGNVNRGARFIKK